MLKKIHWPAVLSAAVSVVGILARPELLALLPGKTATVVAAAGCVAQLVSKSVKKDSLP